MTWRKYQFRRCPAPSMSDIKRTSIALLRGIVEIHASPYYFTQMRIYL